MSTPTLTEPDAGVVQQRDAFVRNLRVIMVRDGVKTRTLADRMDRAYQYVWQRVTGRVVPNLDDLATIAAALDVPVTELVSLDAPAVTFIPGGAS